MGYSPWRHKESDMAKQRSVHARARAQTHTHTHTGLYPPPLPQLWFLTKSN